jgi:glutaredoxin 3
MADIVVYTLNTCPYCHRAKALLASKKAPFREIDVTSDPAAREEVIRRTGQRTFPQVFIGADFVGGCDDLYDLERRGRLDGMLA